MRLPTTATTEGGTEEQGDHFQAGEHHNCEVEMDVEKQKSGVVSQQANNVSSSLLNKDVATEKSIKDLRVYYRSDTPYRACSSHIVKYLIIGCLLLAAVVVVLLVIMFARKSGT